MLMTCFEVLLHLVGCFKNLCMHARPMRPSARSKSMFSTTWPTNLEDLGDYTHTFSEKSHCTGASDIFFSINNSFLLLMPGYLPLKYYTRTSHSSTKALNSVRNNYPHSLKETNLSDPRNCFWSTIMQHERQSCFSLHPSAHIVWYTVSHTFMYLWWFASTRGGLSQQLLVQSSFYCVFSSFFSFEKLYTAHPHIKMLFLWFGYRGQLIALRPQTKEGPTVPEEPKEETVRLQSGG